jgi:hypothetical protein
MNYNPPPEWIEACKRADEERKERCKRILETHLAKVEKEKLERQKKNGRKK